MTKQKHYWGYVNDVLTKTDRVSTMRAPSLWYPTKREAIAARIRCLRLVKREADNEFKNAMRQLLIALGRGKTARKMET